MNCGCDNARDVAPSTTLGIEEISGPMMAAANVDPAALLAPTQTPGVVVGLAELGPPGWIVLGAFALIWLLGGKSK